MCWHYNKQELQLFNLQVVPLRLVHDIRLGLLATWHLQLQLLLWVLLSLVNLSGSMMYSNEKIKAVSVYCHENTLNIP